MNGSSQDVITQGHSRSWRSANLFLTSETTLNCSCGRAGNQLSTITLSCNTVHAYSMNNTEKIRKDVTNTQPGEDTPEVDRLPMYLKHLKPAKLLSWKGRKSTLNDLIETQDDSMQMRRPLV